MAELSIAADHSSQNPSLPSFSHFIKLKENNFPVWKTQISPYIGAHGLFPFLLGTLLCPPPLLPDGSANPEYAKWISRDQFVMAVLTASLSEDALVRIMDCTTSAQIWSTLHDLFAAQSSAQAVHTRLKLASLKMGAESVTSYYTRGKGLVTTLAGAGQHVSDSEFVAFLLAGLPFDYDPLVTSVSTQVTFSTFSQLL